MQKFMFILPVNLLKFDHQHYFQLSASTFFLLNFSCACASIFKPSVIIIACMPWLYVLTENYIFVVPFFYFYKDIYWWVARIHADCCCYTHLILNFLLDSP